MCNKLPHLNRYIDECLRSLIAIINTNPRYKTILSCCGHGKYGSTIIVRIRMKKCNFEWFSRVELPLRYKNGHIRHRILCAG